MSLKFRDENGRLMPRMVLTVLVYEDEISYVSIEARGVKASMGVRKDETINHMISLADKCAKAEVGE